MSEAFEKWYNEHVKGSEPYGIVPDSHLRLMKHAYEAGQIQRDEEVNDLKRKLYLEGVKNNSDRARTEFLEGKLEELEKDRDEWQVECCEARTLLGTQIKRAEKAEAERDELKENITRLKGEMDSRNCSANRAHVRNLDRRIELEADSKRLRKSAEWKTKAINYLIDKHIPAYNLNDGEHIHFMSLLNKSEQALKEVE